MLSSAVVIGGGEWAEASGGELESPSFFTLRFSGVSISGVESTSKSEPDDPKLLLSTLVLRNGEGMPPFFIIIEGGGLWGGDSEQVSLLESLMMRARFDPGNNIDNYCKSESEST